MDQLPQWISSDYLLPAIFLGTFIFGETVVLAGTLLAATGVVSVPALYAMCLLGMLTSDLVWFFFGRRLVDLARRWPWVQARYESLMARLHRIDDGRRFYYLLFYKFVYGIRVVTIIYTSLRRIPLRRFLFLDGIGGGTYLAVVIGLGLLLYRGAAEMAPEVHALRYALAAAVLLFILLRMGTQWLRKRLLDT
jgi:membrane protein DedA with SNARE-associated domain